MLDYARQRAVKALSIPRRAVLATSGPAGLQASEVSCQAIDLDLYLLVPKTSDHLFNLESDPAVTLLTDNWELKGIAQAIPRDTLDFDQELLKTPESVWCEIVRIKPCHIQIYREEGWGYLETIELDSC